MSYTALRVTTAGVVLFEGHARRLASAGAAFRDFAAAAPPGIYRLWIEAGALKVEAREEGPPLEGQPVRYAASPFAHLAGRFPKPGPRGYQSVRLPGVTTLLTSPDGSELYESCLAALVGWDGHCFVLPPEDRPRVASVAIEALESCVEVKRMPLLRASSVPLVLVNAVRGVITVSQPTREPFPVTARHLIERVRLERTSRG